MSSSCPGFSTRQVHSGSIAPTAAPRVVPIHLTAGFRFESYEDAHAHFGDGAGYAYTRTGNPTLAAVEQKLAELEAGPERVGTTEALLTASGQAATVAALLSLAGSGDHIIASTHIYEGTRGLLRDNLTRLGVASDFVADINDPAAWETLIRPETRVLLAESISNATNRVLDVAVVAEVAHRHGIALVIDSTLTTPYLTRPIEYGADFVVHSTSKFLTGQGAAIGGVAIDAGTFDAERSGALYPHLVDPGRLGGPSFAERRGGFARIGYARDVVSQRFGPTPSPFNAFLIGQGVETLSLRVERQSANALAVAEWLEQQPGIAGVDYAGLVSHPDHELAKRYLHGGFGAVFQFTLAGGAAAARSFVEALEVVTHMTHIGDVRTLVLHPASTSHVQLSPEEQQAVGVHPGTLRLSIGIEDAPDLIEDLARGVAAAGTA